MLATPIHQGVRSFFRQLRKGARCLVGRDVWLRAKRGDPTEFHGTDYGGWAIVAESLTREAVVYSFGVGEDTSFDEALIRKYGCVVHAFDPTPKALQWVANHIVDARFVIHPWALSADDGPLRLYLPANPAHVSASLRPSELSSLDYFDAPSLRLSTVMHRLGHRKVDLLKMDIEGAEYAVIDEICASGSIFDIDQLLVEFHHWNPAFAASDTRNAVRRLASCGFEVAWVSRRGHEVLFRRSGLSAA